MSDQSGNNGDHEPLRKRRKRRGDGDGKKAAEIIAFGGPMYYEATARKLLKEAVLVSAEDAEDGGPVIGFDPDDAALNNTYYVRGDFTYYVRGDFSGPNVFRDMTPMMYFANKGDLMMCRYLASRGASITKVSETWWTAMYVASNAGHLEVCEFLQANGASHHIWMENSVGWTPFHNAAYYGHGRDEVVRWLVLQGALFANDSSEELRERSSNLSEA